MVLLLASNASRVVAEDDFDRVVLGIDPIPINGLPVDAAKLFGKNGPKIGVVVVGMHVGSTTEFKQYDVITHINRKPVTSEAEYRKLVAQLKPREPTKITCQRLVENVWKKVEVKATPKKYRDLLQDSVEYEADPITGLTTYKDKMTPRQIGNQRFNLVYVENSKGNATFLRAQSAGDRWVFMEKLIVKSGDMTWSKSFDRLDDVKSRIDSGAVEWVTVKVDEDLEKLIDQIIANRSATVRFEGDTLKRDEKLSSEQIDALRIMRDFVRMKKANG